MKACIIDDNYVFLNGLKNNFEDLNLFDAIYIYRDWNEEVKNEIINNNIDVFFIDYELDRINAPQIIQELNLINDKYIYYVLTGYDVNYIYNICKEKNLEIQKAYDKSTMIGSDFDIEFQEEINSLKSIYNG